MSDNEDLLGDDLGDQSLADYNLGNEEEEQLLADDYDTGGPQNVPTSLGPGYREPEMLPPEYPPHPIEYGRPIPYQPAVEPECVVPNITVEIPNTPLPEHPTYAPYQPPVYEERAVPPAMPAATMESPQIVPTDMLPPVPNGDMGGPRERFISERPPGVQRMPQVRDIPDSLDKVVIPRGGYGGRGRMPWGRGLYTRFNHPYRRNNMHRGSFHQRVSFPPPQVRHPHIQIRADIRPEMRPDIRPEMRPDIRPQIRPEMHPELRPEPEIRPEICPEPRQVLPPGIRPDIQAEMRPDIRPDVRPEVPPNMRQEIHPEVIRPDMRPDMRPDIRPDMRPDIRLDIRPDMRPEICPEVRPELRPDIMMDIRPDIRPEVHPDMRPDIRPDLHPDMRPDIAPPGIGPDIRLPPEVRPDVSIPPPLGPEQDMSFRERAFQAQFPRFQYRPTLDERPPFAPGLAPNVGPARPPFEPRPMFQYPRQFRPFGPVREITPNNVSHMPQVTIRQVLPDKGREPEVRMLPVPIPPNLPVTGKKVLINPHFKGTFQPPSEGLPTYIPTRIQKSPPLSPTLKEKFGPIKDLDDATERFIAEQRNALARAAGRKLPRRSPQRYIENTTIEIENELAHPSGRRRSEDDDLSRRQEEFINANRAGLRRRMRSPSPPPRRSLTPPRRSPERRPRPEPPRREPYNDEESEYRRRLREQENLRERVLRAKEVRRRKNAVALQKQIQDRERENQDRDIKPVQKPEEQKPEMVDKPTITEDIRPDTTRKSPEKPEMEVVKEKEKPEVLKRERSPIRVVKEEAEVNSTCEGLTPPRAPPKPPSPERALTPPLPPKVEKEKPEKERKRDWLDSEDDDLDLILGDIDGILSDDDDTGRFKQKTDKSESSKSSTQVDLRSKLPPKTTSGNDSKKPERQKIIFGENKDREDRKRRASEKSPPVRPVVTSSTKTEVDVSIRKTAKTKTKTELSTNKTRQRIIFDKEQERDTKDETKKSTQPNRRVILQRKIQVSPKDKSVFSRIETDPSQPNAGIFSRAVRTAIGTDNARIVVKRHEETQIEYDSESDVDEDALLDAEIGNVAMVANLPHGMTDTRLKTLAGNDVQSLNLDKEERKAKITFKTTVAAENFKRKFNNKMVAASRLTVTLG